MTTFIDCCARNFCFTWDSQCFHSVDCLFNTARCRKSMFTPFEEIFFFLFTKTCFSVRITCSCVNFTSLALLKLFPSLNTLCDLPPFRRASKQIFFEIKIIFAISLSQMMHLFFIYGEKFWKRIAFKETTKTQYWMTHVYIYIYIVLL